MPSPVQVPLALASAAAPAAPPGIGASLASLGTAVKVLVLSHPASLAAVGGALLGAGAYHMLTRKRAPAATPAPEPAAAPAAA
jgi:hypothetical protein